MAAKEDRIQRRKERVQQKCDEYREAGYIICDESIEGSVANKYAYVTGLLPSILYFILFTALFGFSKWKELDMGALAVPLLISIVVHEGIHGLFFGMYAKDHYRSVEFGILWKSLNPYCYCAEPLTKTQYMIALLMPGFILGTCTGAVALIIGNPTVLLFSILSYFMAGGDFLVAYKTLQFSKKQREELYLDHPDKPGFIALVKDENSKDIE